MLVKRDSCPFLFSQEWSRRLYKHNTAASLKKLVVRAFQINFKFERRRKINMEEAQENEFG